MRKINEVYRINYAGGLYGLIFASAKGKLQAKVSDYNSRGWNLVTHMEDDPNLILTFIRSFILALTLGIWTIGSSKLLIFEKQEN